MAAGLITVPHESTRQLPRRQNYLHELDTAAEDLTVRMRMHRGDLAGDLADRLSIVHGVHIVKRIDLGHTVLHRYDPASKTLEISNHLSSGQQVFKLAAELAYLEFGELIDAKVDEGKFTSDESRTLARLGLANCFAATVLPYKQFHDVAENFRYDIERLSAFYSVSYETIAHRLSTLQRPSMRGVPFSFVRVDRAGNMCRNASPPPVFTFPRPAAPALVERLRDVRQPGQDPGADRRDARRARLPVGGAHRRAPSVAIWSAR